jgi:flagellar hook protein FlgE
MSFYTALTGLNGSQSDISATSNNIANVGTTGFKRSRAEFGDIFATSPLQNASSSIGSGTILKGIKQQFTQGNISSSLNALDLAISGQGFFTLKPSLTSAQKVYTRNGSLNVNNDRYVVDSAGQFLLVYPVNNDGSVTAKDLDSALPLQLPVTSGDPQATSNISLGVNVPAAADVVPDRSEFADGYTFDPANPNTFTNSTSITIFDDLGNPTIATMYFIKTQSASANDPTNKYDTRLVINDTVITPDLVPSVDDAGNQIFIDRFGMQTTTVPDDNYFLEGKGSALYKRDDLQTLVDSQPGKLTGEATEFDFGEEGDRLVEIVTDPIQFNATRESGDADSRVYWGKNFLTVNVDNGDVPVNIDLRPGKYNATQLAAEVERAINSAYGDDSKIQVVQNVDDTLSINLFKLNADGSSTGLTTAVSVDLLSDSYVSTVEGITLTGASPDFTREQFLAHSQARINAALNDYAVDAGNDTIDGASSLGVSNQLFARSVGTQMDAILTKTQIVNLKHATSSAATPTTATTSTADRFMVYSYQGDRPNLSVYDNKTQVNSSGTTVSFDATQNTMTINFASAPSNISINEKIRIGGEFQTADATPASHINGREFTVSNVSGSSITINTTGLSFPDDSFTLTETDIFVMSDESESVEAFF